MFKRKTILIEVNFLLCKKFQLGQLDSKIFDGGGTEKSQYNNNVKFRVCINVLVLD